MKLSGSLDNTNNSVTATGTGSTVTVKSAAGNTELTNYCLLPPGQTINGQQINVTFGGNALSYTIAAPTTDLVAGKNYQYTLTVSSYAITAMSLLITPWDTAVTESAPISTSMAETALTLKSTGETGVTFAAGYQYRTYRSSTGWSAWTDTSASEISLADGDMVQFRGTSTATAYPGNVNEPSAKKIVTSDTGTLTVFGNIMSLRNQTGFATETTVGDHAFSYLFKDATHITDAAGLVLPATTLGSGCYEHLFNGCTSLTKAPALPATTMKTYCYRHMFDGCTLLTTAPALPALDLTGALNCYDEMFNGCTALTIPPALPATTLAHSCYEGMFKNCTALTTAPALPATTLQELCYQNMFEGCTALTASPVLPAATTVTSCYDNMFKGCTHIQEVRCYATHYTSSDYDDWLFGVPGTGNFYGLSSAGWTTGVNAIPSGWTQHLE